MESTIYVKPERIRQYVIDLFGYYHVSKADAAMIADNLIDAEIRGVTTHGLTRIPLYTEKLISGLYDAKAGQVRIVIEDQRNRKFGTDGLIMIVGFLLVRRNVPGRDDHDAVGPGFLRSFGEQDRVGGAVRAGAGIDLAAMFTYSMVWRLISSCSSSGMDTSSPVLPQGMTPVAPFSIRKSISLSSAG